MTAGARGRASRTPPSSTARSTATAFSPLTNVMPIRRHRLHEQPGAVGFAMAWVSLPDLKVHRSEQRYEHLARGRVRFSSDGFTADLELDEHGLVVSYPGIAQRVS